jgi:hypothetical protein
MTMANASMSLTESTDRFERFLLLPKFSYAVPKGTTGSSTTTTTDPVVTAETVRTTFNAKLGDQYTATSQELAQLNNLTITKGAAAVNNALKKLPGTANTAKTIIDFVLAAFK